MTTAGQADKPGLRMKQLVAITGVSKAAILHYLSQNLIPEPIRTSPNMAYYHPECVDRIRFIRHMQQHHRLTLREIGEMLDRYGSNTDIAARVALNDAVFGWQSTRSVGGREQFLELTGLSEKELSDLLERRLLNPRLSEEFDEEDLAMGRVYAQALSWGIRVEDLEFYVDLGEQIVDRELQLRQNRTQELNYNENIETTMQMLKNARSCRSYILDRLFQDRVASMKDINES